MKAAQQGHAVAQSTVGLMYLSGKGVEQNYAKAFELFQRSSNQGYDWGMNNLGGLYEKGWGTEPDLAKALSLYRDAAAKGSGLGLAVVQAIAAAHGGRLEFANRPEGGAVVAIHLTGNGSQTRAQSVS